MTEREKQEWAFFLDDDGELSFCETCLDCDKDCKQSFRVIDVHCPYYEMLKKDRQRERRRERKKVVR